MAIISEASGNTPISTGHEEHLPSKKELALWLTTDPAVLTQEFDPVPENATSRYTLIADRPVKWSAGGSMASTATLAYDNSEFRTSNVIVLTNPDLETDPSLTIDIDLLDAYGNTSSTAFEIVVTNELEAPSAFTIGMWTLTDNTDGTGATVELVSLPVEGDSVILDVEYTDDAGDTWTSLGIDGASDTAVIGLTVAVLASIQIRGVNAVGEGPESDVKTVTPTGP